MSTLASKGPLESKMPALAFYQLKAAILVLSLMITFGTDFWSRILNTFGSKRFFTLFWKCLLSHREFFLFIEFVQIESRPDTSIVRAWTIWESLCPRKFWPWHWTVLFVHLWNFWTGGRICWQFRYLRTLWRLNCFQTGLMCEWMWWKTRSYFGLNGKIGRMHATSYKVARINLMDAFMIWEKREGSKSARCSWHCLGASFCHWHSWWKDIKKSYGFYRFRHTPWLNDYGQPFTEHIQQCHSTTRMGEWSNIRQHLLRGRTFSPDSDCGCGKCVLAPLQISQNSCLSHPKSWLHNYLS